MADFKIKSGAGSGNKTLLQGQDQVDSAYAIEIGDAGATTLTNATLTAGSLASGVTGGAGLSGSTSLGTVTAGNLSNTAIVYPAGHVLQVVQSTSNTGGTTTSTTAVALGDTAAITPIATSSKVLVTITGPVRFGHNNGGNTYIFRNGFALKQISRHSVYQSHSAGTHEQGTILSVSYLDSPATTSSVTYQIGLSSFTGTTYWLPNSTTGDNSVIILQEIKG